MPWGTTQPEAAKVQGERIAYSQTRRRQLLHERAVATTTDLCLLPRQALLLVRSMQSSTSNKACAQLDESEDNNS